MEVAGLAFSVAQTLLGVLQCQELKQLFSIFGYKSELEKLEKTVQTIKSVMLDAEKKQVLNSQEQAFVDNLRSAVYDADDLLDEFATLAQKQHQQLLSEQNSGVSKKVRRLFSHFHKVFDAYSISREVKKVRKEMEEIADDANKFSFKVDNQPMRRRREETWSYVYAPNIIGREDDTNRVVEMLLDPDVESPVSVLSIVGIGGLGKTTLAQLVYNDERILREFPLRLWACVSDEGQLQLNVEAILREIIKSITDENIGHLNKEQLQRKLRGQLDEGKYLLVLDDVWTENRGEWLKLADYIMGGQRGSRIMVTTRSKGTAIAVGSDKHTYEMQGLSDDNSWRLFEMAVGIELETCPNLVEISKTIVKKCANVPLAIKATGTLLYGQSEDKWRAFQNSKVMEIREGENDIMSILKFSYHHLSPSLKSCFSYCAIFPKDFYIYKEMLISLWMAQGFVEPFDGGQSIEDAAEEHFMILLRRCFFQDVNMNEFGEIISCKIHDLMYDIAHEVAKNEICSTSISSLSKTIRHISCDPTNVTKDTFSKSKIRTFLVQNIGEIDDFEDARHLSLVVNLMSLRALDLSSLDIVSLPDAVGNLLHLRYLDLSINHRLQMLPKSITKLHNLQTLNLSYCSELKELPNLSSLVKLRALDVDECSSLTHMPLGIEKLTSLCKLPLFVASGRNTNSKQGVGKIEDLRALKNLKGKLKIFNKNDFIYPKKTSGEGCPKLSNKEGLKQIIICWEQDTENKETVQEHKEMLEELKPHTNLTELHLDGYLGEGLPRWAREENFATDFKNLIRINIKQCKWLQEVPQLGKLHFLKSITLDGLENLEYMEDWRTSCNRKTYHGVAVAEVEPCFFPVLKYLLLRNMPKFKGWWKGLGDYDSSPQLPMEQQHAVFPCLTELYILECPNLSSFPSCRPTIERLSILGVNERLRIRMEDDEQEEKGVSPLPVVLSSSPSLCHPKLKRVCATKVAPMILVPKQVFSSVTTLMVQIDEEEKKNLYKVKEMLCSCSSSLQFLIIRITSRLNLVGVGLEHLTALETLQVGIDSESHKLRMVEEVEEEEGNEVGVTVSIPWRSLARNLTSLRKLTLAGFDNLSNGLWHLTSLRSLTLGSISCCALKEGLPKWIASGCFSSLKSLVIYNYKLESLPEAIQKLTSLEELVLRGCLPVLEKRCQRLHGEDWPKIQHIRIIYISCE